MAHVVLTACGVTTTTTGTGTVDIIDTAPTGYGVLQTIADALADGEITSLDTVDYHILDADGAAWESGRGIITNAATDTLTRSTVLRSSAASDAAITLSSGTHTILFSPSARALDYAVGPYVAPIRGAELIWTDDDTVELGIGDAFVGGKYLSWSSNIASGNISTATAGRSAVGVWNWYLYDNAGTPAVEYVQDTPVWDDDLKHWVKAGPTTTRRWVGYHWVHVDTGDTTRKIAKFMMDARGATGNGIEIVFPPPERATTNQAGHFTVGDSVRLLNAGTSGDFVAIDMSNCVPVPANSAWMAAKMNFTSDQDEAIGGLSPVDLGAYFNAGTIDEGSQAPFTVRTTAAAAGGNVFFGRSWMTLTESQTCYYGIQQRTGTPSLTVECYGVRFIR